jgi:hypothetical protein
LHRSLLYTSEILPNHVYHHTGLYVVISGPSGHPDVGHTVEILTDHG